MMDVKEYFPRIIQTGEGWKANCPSCGDGKQKFYFNTEKHVGCCQHVDCRWSPQRGGVTERRLLAFFSVSGIQPVIPEEIEQSEEADVELPEEFTIVKDLAPNIRDTIYAYLKSRGIPKKIVDVSRIGYCETGDMWGYIIMPVFNDIGEAVYWQGRRFKDRTPKFWNPKSSRKSEYCYIISTATRPHQMVLVESVMNVLTLELPDVRNSVVIGLLGKTLSDSQLQRIMIYEKRLQEVVIALDPDADREAIQIAEKLDFLRTPREIKNHQDHQYDPKPVQIKIAKFPEGEDVNSVGRMRAWEIIRGATAFHTNSRTKDMVGSQKTKDWYF